MFNRDWWQIRSTDAVISWHVGREPQVHMARTDQCVQNSGTSSALTFPHSMQTVRTSQWTERGCMSIENGKSMVRVTCVWAGWGNVRELAHQYRCMACPFLSFLVFACTPSSDPAPLRVHFKQRRDQHTAVTPGVREGRFRHERCMTITNCPRVFLRPAR